MLALRSLLRFHRAPVAAQGLAASLGRQPTVRIPARGLLTAEGKTKSRSKWQAPLLLVATGLVGGYAYLSRERPERKEARRLLRLSEERAQQGDIEQALKYAAESLETAKPLFRGSREMVLLTNEYARLCLDVGGPAAALPYYLGALEYVPEVSDVLERTRLQMKTLMSISSCYADIGNFKASERTFKQVIDAYDRFQGQASLSQTPERDVMRCVDLDILVVTALTVYASLLFHLGRSEEISQARKRVVRIVRGSEQLRSKEGGVLDRFDDFLALEKMRAERRKQRNHGERSVSTF